MTKLFKLTLLITTTILLQKAGMAHNSSEIEFLQLCRKEVELAADVIMEGDEEQAAKYEFIFKQFKKTYITEYDFCLKYEKLLQEYYGRGF